MGIRIITVGKIKEKFYKDAVAEYAKRLSRYVKLEILEVSDEQTPDKAPASLEELIKQREGERILKLIRPDEYVITLEIGGKKMDSVAFSNRLNHLALQGKSHIVFIIGGSLGLHGDVLKRSDEALSFSDMTFPHQLMRVILTEQIYRAYRIMNHEPYHK